MDMVIRVIPVDSSVVLTLIAVLILYFGLKKFLYEPVTDFLKRRQEGIELNLNDAKKSKDEADALKLQYEAKIADSKSESQEILSVARNRAEELRAEIIANAKKEANEIKLKAREDIKREQAVAFDEVKSETVDLAFLMAQKIMKQEIDSKGHVQLIEEFIDEVGSAPWEN